MKQTNLIFCAAFAMGMTACTNENNDSLVNNYSDDITAVRISAPDFIYTGQTRTDFIIDESGAKFIWAENDTVGIFPGKGDQISFPMTSGAGANSASFTGGDWALKESGTYYAYYPFDRWNFASYDKKNNIEVSYVGQAQDGNDSTKDLGKYDFMAAAETASVNGALNLNFEHLGCLLKIEVKAPAAGSYKELSLNLNESLFTTKAKIDLQTSPIVLSSLATANSLSLNLKNVSVTEGETIVCYMMIAPVDLSETTLTLTLKDESGKAFNSEVEGKEYVAGKIYLLGADVANEDISTKVVTLTEPGTLMEKIGGISGALETVNLTLTGPLCGTDIKIIRSMPNLKRLDIENVEFVIANENEAYYNNHKLMPINDLYTNKEYITGERIFAELKTLETVKWSKLTNTIFPYAFNSCGKLSTVIIPDNITLIEEQIGRASCRERVLRLV